MQLCFHSFCAKAENFTGLFHQMNQASQPIENVINKNTMSDEIVEFYIEFICRQLRSPSSKFCEIVFQPLSQSHDTGFVDFF